MDGLQPLGIQQQGLDAHRVEPVFRSQVAGDSVYDAHQVRSLLTSTPVRRAISAARAELGLADEEPQERKPEHIG